MNYRDALEQIRQNAGKGKGFLLDQLSGGTAGFQEYPKKDLNKLRSGKTVNVFFTGASTGFSPGNIRQDQAQFADVMTGNVTQLFRYGDYAKAKEFIKSLPEGTNMNVVGYSHGADSANRLARQFKLPVSLVAPIGHKSNDYVTWAKFYQPTDRNPKTTLNNLIAYIGGLKDLRDIRPQKLHRYAGEHCQGAGVAIKDALMTQGQAPSEKEVKEDSLKSKYNELIYNGLPVAGAVGGGVVGYGLARLLRIRRLWLRLLFSGLGASAGLAAGNLLKDKAVNLKQRLVTV